MIAIPCGFSPEDYLVIERDSRVRHEYRCGLVYAMTGGSDNHNLISLNLVIEIGRPLRDRNCQFFVNDIKVSYRDRFFYYPDLFVTCDPRDRDDRYVKRYPKLIVEVLSPSTEKFDRHDKFADYQLLDSLEEYVLISQERMEVECCRRVGEGPNSQWETEVYREGDLVRLQSIGLEIAIEQLYLGTILT